MIIQNPPSINPADNGTLIGTLNMHQRNTLLSLNQMLPAKVIAYDRTANRVQVQLLIDMVTTGGQQVPRCQLSNIPVFVFGNSRVFLSFDLIAGDLGWVLVSDRDISLFLQTYQEVPPNTPRLFSFSDGVFLPDTMHGYTINPADTSATVLSTLDATVRIAISEGGVVITSPIVTINSTTATLNATTVTVTSPAINMTGTLAVTGDITATGNITPHV